MLSAVSTLIIYKKPDANLATTLLSNRRFTRWEICDEGYHRLNKENIRKLREIASSYGFEYSVHAPWSSINLAESSPPLRNFFVKFMKKSLQRTAEIEGKVWIFHGGRLSPFTFWFPEAAFEAQLKSIRELARFGEDFGVRLAVENSFGRFGLLSKPEDVKKFFDASNVENVGFCLDVGHANVIREVDRFLLNIPDKIIHLHIHDNMGDWDSHLAVGSGNIKWEELFNQLKKNGYGEWVVVENYEISDVERGFQCLSTIDK